MEGERGEERVREGGREGAWPIYVGWYHEDFHQLEKTNESSFVSYSIHSG